MNTSVEANAVSPKMTRIALATRQPFAVMKGTLRQSVFLPQTDQLLKCMTSRVGKTSIRLGLYFCRSLIQRTLMHE